MNIVDSVVRSGLCTGCGLCESIAPKGEIAMQMSPLGYLRPELNPELNNYLSPASERAIAATCPGVQVAHEKGVEFYHPSWGPLRQVQVGHAADAEVRRLGSSGGVISALCIYLLESKAVDFVAQIAASNSNPIANQLQISRTRADVIQAAGSRYGPSAPLQSLRELLATGERFAFVGKPCDVAALRAFIRLTPGAAIQIPHILSFMCAGIPSEKGAEEVIQALGAQKSEVRTFRYRGDGWPGMTRAELIDGRVLETDYNSSWGKILGKHIQFRCKICADGTGEQADIVCADAWYGKNGYPDFTEQAGRSLILARTDSGTRLLKRALDAKVLETSALEVNEIALMQPFQLERKRLALVRGFATFLAVGRKTNFIRLQLITNSIQIGIIKSLRNAWGTFRRCKGE